MTITPELTHVTCPDPAGPRQLALWNWPAANGNNSHVTLCVHGLTRQGRDFDELAKDLSRDRRVVALDVTGRGQSDWLRDPMRYQIPTYVQDMAPVLRHLCDQGMKTLDWVGTSMGGLIGLGVCGYLGAQWPVRRLVLNDASPALEWQGIARIQSYLGKQMEFESLQAAADAMWSVSQGFGPHTSEQWLALSAPMCRPVDSGHPNDRVRLHFDPDIAKALATATPETTAQGAELLWGLYDTITSKTLMLRGAQSDFLTAATAQAMGERGPRATVIELAGIGHAPTLVAPDQRAAIRHFFDSP